MKIGLEADFNTTEHTSYVSAPSNEMHCNPRENEEWHELQRRKEAMLRSRRQDTRVTNIETTDPLMRREEEFLRIGENKKPRHVENKYQRIDEAELLDMLARKFKDYRFWPLKALKEEVQQPEAYLREVLSKIAVLVKTGQAANTWTLKPSAAAAVNLTDDEMSKYETEFQNAKENEIAPGADVSEDDDDDDDDGMEDVV